MSLDRNRLQREIIETLREVPFVNHAVKKSGVSRMTFYRWMKRDRIFHYNITAALQEGHKSMIEVAESGLLKKVKEGHFNAIKFYLENNHGNYMNRKYHIQTTSSRNIEDAKVLAYTKLPEDLVLTEKETHRFKVISDFAKEKNIPFKEFEDFIEKVLNETTDEVDEEQKN